MSSNPYQAPQTEHTFSGDVPVKYGGFWIRVAASLIDTIWMMLLTTPLLMWMYGADYLFSQQLVHGPMEVVVNYVLPAIAVLVFWIYLSATPGKLALNLYITDARTGGRPSKGQLLGRYLCYYVSMIPLFLGFFWVGWDRRKQGFHDKLAGTVVVVGKPAWLQPDNRD
ncbi:MAG: RDD family protein [Alcanivoracaceae bacterium]